MNLKRVLGSVVCAFSLMAAGIGAQAANIPAHTATRITEQAAAQTTTQTHTAVKINPQNADMQTFKNQKGETIYPMFYENSIYLPLRNIGELTGMDVTWYSAKAENDVNAIFLRMPLSDSKRTEMETYAMGLMKQLLDMREDMKKFDNCAVEVKNSSYTDYVITDKATAMAALDSIKRKAQNIRSSMTEQANPIRYYNSSLMNGLDFLINNADTVMNRVQNGRVVLGSSNPDTSVVDETAVMFGAADTMLDCQRMVRMLRQNMDILF